MIASASSGWRLVAIACGALALTTGSAPAAELLAQVGAPVQLLPPGTDQGSEVPAPADPAVPEPAPAMPGAEQGTAAPLGFEIESLEEAGNDYVGTLSAADGALPPDLWRGTDRAKVERLLPRLQPTLSPALGDLTRRLLLSSAGAPAGKGSGLDLIALRARLLAGMGSAADAIDLLRLLPETRRNAESDRLLADLSWQVGDAEGACVAIAAAIARGAIDDAWQRALIFCQIRAGNATEAMLGLDLLREQGETDPAFDALADALLAGSDAEIKALPVPTPLHLAMLRAAGRPLPESLAKSADPVILAMVAADADADPGLRLAVAERAALAGVLPAATLAEVYAAQAIDPVVLDAALDRADLATPEARAALYQATAHAAAPADRARLLQRALTPGGSDFWLRLQVYLPFLGDVAPAADLAWFAPDAARSLYAGGRFEAAAAWLALAQDPTTQDPVAVDAVPALQALAYFAGAGGPVPAIGALLEARQGGVVSGSDPRTGRLLAIVDAFDASLDVMAAGGAAVVSTADSLVDIPQRNANLWIDLGDAAAQGRVGETILLALIGLQGQQPEALEPQWLERVLASLRRVGLEDAARRIAVETAVANGL